MIDPHKPCPQCVQACIDALPEFYDGPPSIFGATVAFPGYNVALATARSNLQGLLPQPDKAKELVDAYYDHLSIGSPTENSTCMKFTRWLLTKIDNGEVKL